MGGDDNTKIKELEEEILQLKIDNKEWRKRFIGESENLNVDLQVSLFNRREFYLGYSK